MPLIEVVSELDCAQPAPVWVSAGKIPDGVLRVTEEGSGRTLPAQRVEDKVVFIAPALKAGAKQRYRLEGRGREADRVTLKEASPHALEIHLPETGLFTAYNFDPAIPRPFFYPVLGPGAKSVTRSYPMKDVEGEAKDHPHHRSFWTAYGEVNDVDDWSEVNNDKTRHGFIKHQKFLSRAEGPVLGGFQAANLWTSHDGKPLLDERRSLWVYNVGPDRRLLDYQVELIAAHGDVHYGDTKEGGILAFRVATTMDGNKGGLMENSEGAKGEKQVWGKRAEWLDYSGPVDGQTLGITMMDHPGNLNHPCYWHARDYGLVGTNPFAKASFEKGLSDAGHVQKNGETLRFRYRVMIHRGGAKEGGSEEAYHAWVQGPQAKVVG